MKPVFAFKKYFKTFSSKTSVPQNACCTSKSKVWERDRWQTSWSQCGTLLHWRHKNGSNLDWSWCHNFVWFMMLQGVHLSVAVFTKVDTLKESILSCSSWICLWWLSVSSWMLDSCPLTSAWSCSVSCCICASCSCLCALSRDSISSRMSVTSFRSVVWILSVSSSNIDSLFFRLLISSSSPFTFVECSDIMSCIFSSYWLPKEMASLLAVLPFSSKTYKIRYNELVKMMQLDVIITSISAVFYFILL